MLKCVAIRVTGRVQHVGFRYFAIQEAEKLDIKGFVRNEPDGSVYLEAEGEEESLDAYIVSMQKGPAWSRVDRVFITNLPGSGFRNFSVRH